MAKHNVHGEIGEAYVARVGPNITVIRLTRESRRGGWDAVNLVSGCMVHVNTRMKLRRHVPRNVVQRVVDIYRG